MSIDITTLIWSVINFAILLAIPIALITLIVKFHKRLKWIEEAILRLETDKNKSNN